MSHQPPYGRYEILRPSVLLCGVGREFQADCEQFVCSMLYLNTEIYLASRTASVMKREN